MKATFRSFAPISVLPRKRPMAYAVMEFTPLATRAWPMVHQVEQSAKLILGWGPRRVEMCDYSLHHVKSRPAKVGDQLTTRDFNLGTRGFAASENNNVAVCVMPGTELSFANEVTRMRLWPWTKPIINYKTAIFRQINRHDLMAHHDALEFPDGKIVLLTHLTEGQRATVLQLPATAVESKATQREAYEAPAAMNNF